MDDLDIGIIGTEASNAQTFIIMFEERLSLF